MAVESTNKYLTLGGLQSYDTLIKQWTEDKIEGAEPRIKKLETAESGFLSSYQLVMGEGDEEKVLGNTINIPKDFLVKSGTVVELSAEEATAAGLSAAGTYLKLVLNAKEGGDNAESVVYIDVATLFNDYDVEKDATQIQLAISEDHVISAVVKAGSITVTELGDDAVETVKIKDGNVTEAKIADDAVTEDKIADEAVTEDKVADDAISTDKIVDANVTTAKLADEAVETAKIKDANVTTAKIATVLLLVVQTKAALLVLLQLRQSLTVILLMQLLQEARLMRLLKRTLRILKNSLLTQ